MLAVLPFVGELDLLALLGAIVKVVVVGGAKAREKRRSCHIRKSDRSLQISVCHLNTKLQHQASTEDTNSNVGNLKTITLERPAQ